MKRVFLTPKEVFSLLNRESERQRILLAGVEAIAYAHPHKKFYFRMDEDDYEILTKASKENPAPGSWGGTISFDVMDYGIKVGRVRTYKPEGNDRDKIQVQFEYDYDVHQKEPKNVKRSSDHKKILEFARLFRTEQKTNMASHEYFSDVPSLLGNVTKLRDKHRAVGKFVEQFYFGDKIKNMQLMYDLIHQRTSPESIKYKADFMKVYDEAKEAEANYNKLTNRIAVVCGTPHGEYGLARYEYNAGVRDMAMSYHCSFRVVGSKDDLPEDVMGKMAVLEIANTTDSVEVVVDGVGIFSKNTNFMVVIGEDLNGIDPRTEGQDPSSQSS